MSEVPKPYMNAFKERDLESLAGARRGLDELLCAPLHLSGVRRHSEFGTHKTVKARFRPWLSDGSP